MANTELSNGNTTPLSRVSYTGNLDMAKLLIDTGANIEVPTKNGNTPIMWASFVGNAHIVEYLISKGASINHYNCDGKNAMDLAVSRMQYSCALLLFKNGMKLRTIEEYKQIVRSVFDLDKFLVYLRASARKALRSARPKPRAAGLMH